MGGYISATETTEDANDVLNNKTLDLSRRVGPDYFKKNGHVYQRGLTEFPYELRDNITLYEVINASFNSISVIPEEISRRVPHLTKLVLSHNTISTLPPSFKLLFHLKELLLDHNEFTRFPDALASFDTLEKLDLSHNRIKTIAMKFHELKSLKKINLSHNQLDRLPVSISLCPLEVLLLRENQLILPPQSKCNLGSAEAIRSLRELAPIPALPHPVQTFPRVRSDKVLIMNSNSNSTQTQYKQLQSFPNRVKTPLIPPLGSTQLTSEDLKDRITGLIYGAAIGDSLATATEHLSKDDCLFHYNPSTLSHNDIICDEHRSHWRKGDWSPVFDQMIIVLDSLIKWSGVADELEFAKRLKEYSMNGFSDLSEKHMRALPSHTRQVVDCEEFTTDPHKTCESHPVQCEDNSTLQRALLLGTAFFFNVNEVVVNSRRINQTTHSSPLSQATSSLLSAIVALVMQAKYDCDMNGLLNEALKYSLADLSDENKQIITDLVTNKRCPEKYQKSDHCLFTMKIVLQTLLWAKPYRETLMKILIEGGEIRMAACIVGGLHGSFTGYSGLPREWISGLPQSKCDWLNIKVNHFLDLMAIP